MTIGSDNPFPSVKIVETASGSLGTVGSGNERLSVDPTSHLLYWKDNSGTVRTAMTNPMTTAGDTIYGGASGVPTRLAGGTSTYVLTSNGATSAPSWQAPGGGGSGALTFLEAHTASSSSSLDFTTFINSTYDTYMIEGMAIAPATNTADLLLEFGSGGGPTWDTSNYNFGTLNLNYSTSGTIADNSASSVTPRIFKSMANDAGYGNGSFTLWATNLQSTSQRRKIHGTGTFANTTTPAEFSGTIGIVWTDVAHACTGLRFIMSSGNIASGTIRIYGVSKS